MAKPKLYFKEGDRVAWSHDVATQHGSGSVLRATAIPAASDELEEGRRGWLGTVQATANDEGTHYTVKFDNGSERVLTYDELVKIEEEAA